MDTIILAGGFGTRLWPSSRKTYPKQFLTLHSEKTLIKETIERIQNIRANNKIIVSVNKNYNFLVESIIDQNNENIEIVTEPISKNTLPAIMLAIRYLKDKHKASRTNIVFISPSDHIIESLEKFSKTILKAEEAAKKGFIVTLGIIPNRVETDYGYIEKGDKIENNIYLTKSFVEKPPYDKAKQFIETGGYYWNSGMFIFPIWLFEEELEKYEKEMFSFYSLGYEKLYEKFHLLPSISIDYAIMEKTTKAATIETDIMWSDIGSWDSLYETLKKDDDENVIIGDALAYNIKRTLIYNKTSKRVIVGTNINDLIIVDTDDVLLVAKKGSSQSIKGIVNDLDINKSGLTTHHLKTYRSWGNYKVLDKDESFKVERIEVYKDEELSLQFDEYIAKQWTIVVGIGEITIDDKIIKRSDNDTIFIPNRSKHRIKNIGDNTLIFIEIQYCDCL